MRIYQCAVMGPGGVGKSAVTVRFINGNYLEWYDPTIEDSYRKQFNVDGQPAILEILDTAGVEQFLSLNDLFIRESEAFILVFALNQRDTYEEVAIIRRSIYQIKDPPNGVKIPIVIVGNKSDLVDERAITAQEAGTKARSWGCQYLETSAKNDIGIHAVFEQVVRELRKSDERKEAVEEEISPVTTKRKKMMKMKMKARKCVIL